MFTIPAIDLRDGAVVRLQQGRFETETRYAEDPAAVASRWREEGAEWIHVVDLDGAASGRPRQLEALERIATSVGGPIQYGGGLRTLRDVADALAAGADRVVLGTAAIDEPDLVRETADAYGERLVVAIDVRRGRVCTSAWQQDVPLSPRALAERLDSDGVRRIIYTDVTADGTLRGPNIEAATAIAAVGSLAVIASGGVSSLSDIRRLLQLREAGIEGVIVGRALYEGCFTLRQAIVAEEGG